MFVLGSSPFCLSQDANSEVCQLVENFFGFMPFQQVVNILAGSLTVFTTNIQIQEILDYITQSFGPNPFNITDYESMSKSFNLIIFQPWVKLWVEIFFMMKSFWTVKFKILSFSCTFAIFFQKNRIIILSYGWI